MARLYQSSAASYSKRSYIEKKGYLHLQNKWRCIQVPAENVTCHYFSNIISGQQIPCWHCGNWEITFSQVSSCVCVDYIAKIYLRSWFSHVRREDMCSRWKWLSGQGSSASVLPRYCLSVMLELMNLVWIFWLEHLWCGPVSSFIVLRIVCWH